MLAQGLLEPLRVLLADENPIVRGNAVVTITELARHQEAAFWTVEKWPILLVHLQRLVNEHPEYRSYLSNAIAWIEDLRRGCSL